tara:strand:+ start:292 stop:618 length:327 start_codon:yes stop_codon:yes gene_type:complete
MDNTETLIFPNYLILNVDKQFIRYVQSGNYAICEIPTTIYIPKNIKSLYLYTGNMEWLKVNDFTSYSIEYRNKMYNVWFCDKVYFKYIYKNTDIKKNFLKKILNNAKI